jgi:PAS domain S-box-containing protein
VFYRQNIQTARFEYVSPKTYEMTGFTPEEFQAMDLETQIEKIHPDDLPVVQDFAQELIDADGRGEGHIEREFRMRNKTGTYRWIHGSYNLVRDSGSSPWLVVGSLADITERRQAEEQIRQLNKELEQRVVERTAQLTSANKELEAFSYSVSHDLRAPLRSLTGFSAILLEDYAEKLDDQGKRYLARIQDASQSMDQLISDLLNLSRMTRSEIIIKQVDLSMIAKQIATELKAQDSQRQIQFEIAANINVLGDENLLRIVMKNLMANACKFTSHRQQAIIQFGVTEQDGKMVYFVRDNGAGFNMEYAGRLFGAFQRLHGEKEFPGTGVGLAIVQRIIHRHEGQIWAEGFVDKGATFYFRLRSGVRSNKFVPGEVT